MKYELHYGNCLDILPNLQGVSCIFADPPDNIDLAYGEYQDKIPHEEYVQLLSEWTDCFAQKAWTTWISFNTRWAIDMGVIAKALQAKYPELEIKPMVQVFTFGQHNHHDFGNTHRPLWRFRWPDAPIYTDAIRIPSWRQLNGDKRADPRGRVPGDVFNFPRVTGNSKQRRRWHPTQLHEDLVQRCIKSCTQEGDLVVDPFAGTGTTLRVCKRIGRSCITMDVDRSYCERIAHESSLPQIH